MTAKILAALAQLDVGNDNHWTADGSPRLDTVRLLATDSAISREAVTAAAPGFSRAQPTLTQPAQAPAAPAAGGSTTPATLEAPAAGNEASQGSGNVAQSSVDTAVAADAENGAGGQELSPAQAIAEAERELASALEAQAAAGRVVAQATAALDLLLEAQQKSGESSSLAVTVAGYMASQQRARDQRAARMDAMRGVKLADVLPTKAAIDEAFRRRTGRGTKRPTSL